MISKKIAILATMLVVAGNVHFAMAEDTGSIKGTAKWDGKAPKTKTIDAAADPKCAAMHSAAPLTSEKLVINANGTVKNLFVYVKSGLPAGKKWDAPKEPVVLDQKGCQYVPHVFGVVAGQEIKIRNSDDTAHNINASPKNNEGFNQGQPKKDMEFTKTFAIPEMMVPFKCDVHPWMNAYCAVMEHPFFAVTDENGDFEIKGLPAGEYVLATWHEHTGLKSQEMTVSVKAGEPAAADFTFSRPQKEGDKEEGGADASTPDENTKLASSEVKAGSCCHRPAVAVAQNDSK